MSATVGSLNVEVQLQLAKMQAQFDSLTSSVRQHTGQISSEFSKMGGQVERVFERVVEYASVRAFLDLGTRPVENGEQIERSVEAARMSAESFQVLNVLARDSGVGIEQLTRGVDEIAVKIGQAAQGVKAAQKPFQDLGLDRNKLAQMKPDQQFEAVARAVASAKDQGVAFTDAMEILGTRAGPQLLAVLQKLGTEGFDTLKTKMEGAGLIISDAVAAKLNQMGIEGDDLTKTLEDRLMVSLTEIGSIGGKSLTDLKVKIEETKAAIADLTLPGRDQRIVGATVEAYRKHLIELDFELAKATKGETKHNAALQIAQEAYRRVQADAAALAAAEKAHSDQIDQANDAANQAMMQRIKEAAAGMKAVEEQRSRELEAEASEGVRMWEETRTSAEKYRNELAEINQLERDGFVSADTAQRARELTVQIDKLKKALEELKAAEGDHKEAIAAGETNLKQLQQQYDATEKVVEAEKEAKRSAEELGHSLANTLVDGAEKGEKFRDVLKGIAADIAKMLIQSAITQPLGNLFGSLLGGAAASGAGSGGILGALIGGLAGARAGGGPVEAGKPYLVSEAGPEVIVPGGSGTVLPNGTAPGSGGTVNFNNNFGGGVSREDIVQMIPALIAQQKSALADAARRGGPLAQLLGTA